ncbi:hypothetical protein CR513_06724, partial [Mucuna pruriens]
SNLTLKIAKDSHYHERIRIQRIGEETYEGALLKPYYEGANLSSNVGEVEIVKLIEPACFQSSPSRLQFHAETGSISTPSRSFVLSFVMSFAGSVLILTKKVRKMALPLFRLGSFHTNIKLTGGLADLIRKCFPKGVPKVEGLPSIAVNPSPTCLARIPTRCVRKRDLLDRLLFLTRDGAYPDF